MRDKTECEARKQKGDDDRKINGNLAHVLEKNKNTWIILMDIIQLVFDCVLHIIGFSSS